MWFGEGPCDIMRSLFPFMDHLSQELRSQGYRMTKARKIILEILKEKHCPLTVQDLQRLVSDRKISVNLSTIYRELQFLQEKDIVKGVFLKDGLQRFEYKDMHHHHHLVCRTCQKVDPVDMADDLDALEKEITKKTGFIIEQHSLEFYGLCPDCSSMD
jgi:Fur family ferric uptake transcriptional regulator